MKSVFKKIITAILRLEARVALARYKPKIAAVVGTVGKTSTKDAVFSVLSRKYFVRKSEKSFNSELGVPLAILGLPNAWTSPFGWVQNIFHGLRVMLWGQPFPEWLVLELGVDRPGDMRKTAKWIRPDAVILTRFGHVPAHVEFFPSPQALIAEKSIILKSLKQNGVLVLNVDDDKVLTAGAMWNGKKITYGFSEGAGVLLEDFAILLDEKRGTKKIQRERPIGVGFQARHGSHIVSVHIMGTLGKGITHSVGAALAFGLEEGVDLSLAAQSFDNYSPPPGRLRLLPGVKETTIIDDTYNSSPIAAELALETLSSLEAQGRRIAVLGDMLELGKHTKEEHRKVGALAGGIADILITVGIRARDIAEGALDSKMDEENIYQFDTSDETRQFLQDLLQEGDFVLIKGSQGMRMERIVEEIMEHPEHKADLLVRQDHEWEKR